MMLSLQEFYTLNTQDANSSETRLARQLKSICLIKIFHLQWYMNFVAQVSLGDGELFQSCYSYYPTPNEYFATTLDIHLISTHITTCDKFYQISTSFSNASNKGQVEGQGTGLKKKIILLGPTMFILCVTDSVVRFFLPIIMACELQI